MSLTLQIEYDDGSTTDLPADSLSVTRALDEQDRAEITVPRSDWTSAEPNTPRTAKLYALADGTQEFGGRLDDVQTDGGTATVRLNSPEIDAAEAEPTGDNLVYQNVGDDAIVTDQVQAVPTLSAGTVTQQASAISYSVSHGSRSKVLYDLRKPTGSEFRYNDDWTVDYVDRLGSDKSGSVTLGPAEGNIGDGFNKQQDARENVTHVKALGAQSGPDQVVATATAPSYSSGRKIWKRYENKEVQAQSRLQSIADQLVAEYDDEPRALTVECTAYPNQIDADLQLGDSVYVDYPEENVQRSLRITNITSEWTRRGHVAQLTLSNRTLSSDDRDTKARDDLQRFNRGYQGFVDRNQTTSGWNPAGDTVPQTLEIPNWPDDIVSEERVELTVQGRAWRAPLDITNHDHSVEVTHPSHDHSVSVTHPSHSHDVTHPSHDHSVSVTHPSHSHDVTHPSHDHDVTHPSHDHSVSQSTTSSQNNQFSNVEETTTSGVTKTLDDTSWTTIDTFTPSNPTSLVIAQVSYYASDPDGYLLYRMQDAGGDSVPGSGGFFTVPIDQNNNTGENSFTGVIAKDENGTQVGLEMQTQSASSLDVFVYVNWTIIGKHDHDISVSTTSSAELGTTETSTTALGTTESSTTELGTTETATSSTELGTTESSTTELGTTETATSSTELGTTESSTTDAKTPGQAQVIDTFGGSQYYPTDVEIRVNGSLITTIAGDGTADWQETVNLAGELSPGSNTITATPTGQRGEANLILSSELFRRGRST